MLFTFGWQIPSPVMAWVSLGLHGRLREAINVDIVVHRLALEPVADTVLQEIAVRAWLDWWYGIELVKYVSCSCIFIDVKRRLIVVVRISTVSCQSAILVLLLGGSQRVLAASLAPLHNPGREIVCSQTIHITRWLDQPLGCSLESWWRQASFPANLRLVATFLSRE